MILLCFQHFQFYLSYWGMYRCMGAIQTYGANRNIQGAYRCMGGLQMYGPYRHMGVYKHTGGIQIHGLYRLGGVQMLGSYRHPPNTQIDIPPHACQLHLGTIFLMKFKFVPSRHILRAYQLASSTAIHEASQGSF